MADTYITVKNYGSFEYEDRKSVFIGEAMPVSSESEALAFIDKVKKTYPDARHHVYAYVLRENSIARFTDDSEPQGTAGMPVLEAIRKSGVDDVCIVVTRYFGGILLGAGGLVRAYSHSAVIAIEGAEVVTYEPYCEYELACGYSEYQKYSNILTLERAVIDSTDFAADVTVRFAIKRTLAESLLKRISEASYGKDVPVLLGERFDCR